MTNVKTRLLRYLYFFFGTLTMFIFIGAGLVAYVFWHFNHDLPDYSQLKNYTPPITTRVHAHDGQVVNEFAVQKRLFVPIEVIPQQVIQGFLSAEDKNFYSHPGIDILGMFRIVVTNIKNIQKGKRLEGASTITQQVATNFLLNRSQNIHYKVRQILLAFTIEQSFSKQEILELYLNEIYLGSGVYGVAAAALHYFDKSLDELSTEEIAYLAAIPKGPNNYHPVRNYDRAVTRRNWVIRRLYEDGMISEQEKVRAQNTPLKVALKKNKKDIPSDYFVEEVRRQVLSTYGFKGLYEGGLSVRTTMDSTYQTIAYEALRKGLIRYDRRHGWRGAQGHVVIGDVINRKFDTKSYGQVKQESISSWKVNASHVFKLIPKQEGTKPWQTAIVIGKEKKKILIGFQNGQTGEIPHKYFNWARKYISDESQGPYVSTSHQVVDIGDVILVDKVEEETSLYSLQQIPKVSGALVVMDPHTGRVLALSGGYSYELSEFNRATQAKRQPGSAFKPFVYITALSQGYAPNSIILDAPFVYEQGPGLPLWRPKNYSDEYYGPTPLRIGIEKSRNLMTVRLANNIGMSAIKKTAQDFGIYDDLPEHLSMSLGAGETTALKITTAYSMLVNGGKKIAPTFIDRVQNRYGKTVYRHDARFCEGCDDVPFRHQAMPILTDQREQIIDERLAYQMTSILEGAIQRGTGVRARSLNRPLAGKTGTTNESKDTWFVGFTPNLTVGVYVGFDNPKPLGKKETGSSVALPIFIDFMKEAMKDIPKQDFRVPDGLIFAESDGILQAFMPGTEPGSGGAIHDVSWEDEYYGDYGDEYGNEFDPNADYYDDTPIIIESIEGDSTNNTDGLY